MKLQRRAWWGAGLALLLSARGASAQGTFQNLDFESATIVPVPGDPNGLVEWGAAMPHWTGYIGGNTVDRLVHNGIALSLASMGIFGPDFPTPGNFQGHYFVQLKPGLDPGGSGQTVGTTIAQNGTVPNVAASIQFYAKAAAYLVTFAGHEIPTTLLGGSSSTYFVYGGDISSYAGQMGELRFFGTGYLDNIQFSDQPIPEPGLFSLLTLGTLLLGWRVLGWRQRDSRQGQGQEGKGQGARAHY